MDESDDLDRTELDALRHHQQLRFLCDGRRYERQSGKPNALALMNACCDMSCEGGGREWEGEDQSCFFFH